MGVIRAKIEYSKNGANDEYYTPNEAVELILPFIPPKVKTIWECTAIEESRIVKVLRSNGYNVIPTHIKDGFDFFEYKPIDFDLLVTNPPYSIKDKFLKRAFELNKPFMFLLPTTTLEGLKRGKMFRDHKIQLIIPDRRFSFTDKKNGAWFHTSWFTYELNLPKDLNFISIEGTTSNLTYNQYAYNSILNNFNEIDLAA